MARTTDVDELIREAVKAEDVEEFDHLAEPGLPRWWSTCSGAAAGVRRDVLRHDARLHGGGRLLRLPVSRHV